MEVDASVIELTGPGNQEYKQQEKEKWNTV
jgi:hypothetical protein